MSRTATDQGGGGGFRPEYGVHSVVCCQIIDLGTHDKEWKGKVVGRENIINLAFEFIDVTLEGETGEYHPLWGFNVSNSLGKKANLRKLLEGWRGKAFTDDELKGFDLSKLVGLGCQLMIQPNSNDNPKVTGIAKAKQKLVGDRELKQFFIDEDWSGDIPDDLPDWMQEAIAECYEYVELQDGDSQKGPPVADSDVPADFDEYEDSIPF